MQKLTCFCLLGFAACAGTEFVRMQAAASQRNPRPAHEVEVFFGSEPQRAYTRVGYFDRAPNDYLNETAGDLANEMRRKAGYEGCDAVIIPAREDLERLAASSTEKARAYCAMYTAPVAVKAQPPSEEPKAEPAAVAQEPKAQPVLSSKEEPLKLPVRDSVKATAEAPVKDEAACDQGKADACIRAGIAAEKNKETLTAFALFEKGCASPNPRACTHKGIVLLQGGTGVKKDEAQALELFTKACVLDDAIACRYQGVMYVEGRGGVKKSVIGGLGYLQKACTAKDGWACWRMSQVYKKGEGTEKDVEKAKSYEQSACDNGYSAACGKSAHASK